MTPTDFPQANITFTKPANMTDEECLPLRIHKGLNQLDQPCLVSKWILDAKDLEEVNKNKAIYLQIMGEGMPPVWLFAESPFNEPISEEQRAQVNQVNTLRDVFNELRKDKDLSDAWKDNITACFIDAMAQNPEKEITHVANIAAANFLNLLTELPVESQTV